MKSDLRETETHWVIWEHGMQTCCIHFNQFNHSWYVYEHDLVVVV